MVVAVKRYGSRNWAVYVNGELLVVAVYKRGAMAVADYVRTGAMAVDPAAGYIGI